MRYSVRQASRMVGMSRKTLYAHIKQGKVSAQSNPEGDKVIDHSELLRVYGLQLETPRDTEKDSLVEEQKKAPVVDGELEKYKQHVRALVSSNKNLRDQNAMLKEMVIDARQREREASSRYEKTLSIFERMLPGISK